MIDDMYVIKNKRFSNDKMCVYTHTCIYTHIYIHEVHKCTHTVHKSHP